MTVTGAGVLLHNGRKVLLVHEKSSGMWGIPKGCKNPDESNCDCWKRELKEETGIESLPRHKIIKDMDVLKYNITEAQIFTDHLPVAVPGDEIIETMWVSIKVAHKLNLNALTRSVLRANHICDPYQAFRSCQRMVRVKLNPQDWAHARG